MKITAITQQVKRPTRYSVYVDGKFAFGLGEGQLLSSGLTKGKEITEVELAELQGESQLGKLFDRTLNLLSYRPRSEYELRTYLKRKKVEEELIDKILNKLSKLGYVDDADFAKRWVEHRRSIKATSSLKLRSELKQKGISHEYIDMVLSEQTEADSAAIQRLIEKKRGKYEDTQKLMAYLARQGFRYDEIKRALSESEDD